MVLKAYVLMRAFFELNSNELNSRAKTTTLEDTVITRAQSLSATKWHAHYAVTIVEFWMLILRNTSGVPISKNPTSTFGNSSKERTYNVVIACTWILGSWF